MKQIRSHNWFLLISVIATIAGYDLMLYPKQFVNYPNILTLLYPTGLLLVFLFGVISALLALFSSKTKASTVIATTFILINGIQMLIGLLLSGGRT